MAAIFGDPPFERGRTAGVTSATDGEHLVGREYWFPDINWNATTAVKPARSNRWVLCRIVRNLMTAAVSSTAAKATLQPKKLVSVSTTTNSVGANTGVAGISAESEVLGIARLAEIKAYPVDEFLPAAGCPLNDLCYIVLEGPAMVITTHASFASVLPGDLVAVSTATTAAATDGSHTHGGKAYIFDGAHTDKGAAAVLGIVGRCLSARTTDNTNSDLLIDVIRTF